MKSHIDLLEKLAARLNELECHPTVSNGKLSARCPAHDDTKPSFSAEVATDSGNLLKYCHAGCTNDAIDSALGWRTHESFPAKGQASPKPRTSIDSAVSSHPLTKQYGTPPTRTYRDAAGHACMVAVRWQTPTGKECRPLSLQWDGTWGWKAPESNRPLYRLPEILKAQPDTPVLIVEGEPAADAAASLGFNATTSAMGSKAAKKTDFSVLVGRHVVICPDNDKPGEEYAKDVTAMCFAAGCSSVRIIRLTSNWPDLPEGGDIADLVAFSRGNEQRLEQLQRDLSGLIAAAEPQAAPTLDAPAQPSEKVATTHPPLDLARSATLNDHSVAATIVLKHHQELGFNTTRDSWCHYENGCWTHCKGYHVVQSKVKQAVADMRQRITEGAEHSENAAKFVYGQLGTQRRIESIAKSVKAEPALWVDDRRFDREPMLLNVANGTLDLSDAGGNDFLLREHCHTDYLTQQSATIYDPTATSDLWDRVVFESLGGDADVISYVQCFFGTCLTGDVSDERIQFFIGAAAGGKTTLTEAVAAMLGRDYARPCPVNFLKARDHDPHPADLDSLRGLRMTFCSENDHGKGLRTSIIKVATGGDSLSSRGMNQNYSTWRPTFKMLVLLNDYPTVPNNDEGLARRLAVVPFTTNFQKNGSLDRSIKPELVDSGRHHSAILNWCLQGLRLWRRQGGLKPPAAVNAATRDLIRHSDFLDQFIEERCVVGDEQSVHNAELLVAIEAFLKQRGQHQLRYSLTRLTRELKDKGFGVSVRQSAEHRGKRFYEGLSVHPAFLPIKEEETQHETVPF